MSDKEPLITANDLPITFKVKYLGNHPAKGLWGMKHTRKPVDYLVSMAKNLPPDSILPLVQVEINKEGLSYMEVTNKKLKANKPVHFSIDSISYGVQDLVYTRVFSIIIVTGESLQSCNPFTCHSFLCDSRNQARSITYALAAAFQDYGRRMKEESKETGKLPKRLAIDLRSPEEQADESDGETDA